MSDEALRESILLWEQKLDPLRISLGSNVCPLCRLYRLSAGCGGCPVKRYTGEAVCRNTPYAATVNALRKWQGNEDNLDYRNEFRVAA